MAMKSSVLLFHYTHHVPGPCREELSPTAEPVHLSLVPDPWAGSAGTLMDWSDNIAVGCECKIPRWHHYPRDSYFPMVCARHPHWDFTISQR